MGFAANQARLEALISRKSDLELESQFIEQHKLYYGNMANGYFNMKAQLDDPESRAAKELEGRIKQLQQAEKILDMHLRRIKSQVEASEKQIEAMEKMTQKNIQSSFGLMGGARGG